MNDEERTIARYDLERLEQLRSRIPPTKTANGITHLGARSTSREGKAYRSELDKTLAKWGGTDKFRIALGEAMPDQIKLMDRGQPEPAREIPSFEAPPRRPEPQPAPTAARPSFSPVSEANAAPLPTFAPAPRPSLADIQRRETADPRVRANMDPGEVPDYQRPLTSARPEPEPIPSFERPGRKPWQAFAPAPVADRDTPPTYDDPQWRDAFMRETGENPDRLGLKTPREAEAWLQSGESPYGAERSAAPRAKPHELPARVIDVEGIGLVEFPEGMTDEMIAAAIEEEMGPSLAASMARAVPRGTVESIGTSIKGLGGITYPSAYHEDLAVLDRIEAARRAGDEAGAHQLVQSTRVGRSLQTQGYYSEPDQAIAETRRFLSETPKAVGLDVPLKENPLVRAGQAVEDFAEETFPLPPHHEQRFPVEVARGVGSTGAFLAARLVPGIGQVLLPLTALSMGAGEALDAAMEHGVPDEVAAKAAVLGMLPGGTDIAPIENLLRPLGSGTGLAWSIVRKALEQAAIEGGQEGLQQFMQNMIARAYDAGRLLGDDVIGSMGVGAAVGLLFGSASGARRRTTTDQPPPQDGGNAPGATGTPSQAPVAPQRSLKDLMADPRPVEEIRAEDEKMASDAAEAERQAIIEGNGLPGLGSQVSVAMEGTDPITGRLEEVFSVDGTPGARIVRDNGEAVEVYLDDAKISMIEGDATPEKPVKAETAADVDVAASRVDTAPTPAQKEAGNYRKGHVNWKGLDIAIENPRGSTRSGTGPDGKPWSVKMLAHYGYIKRSEGRDGDGVDVYLGIDDASDQVFIVDQINPETGAFDEHKAILGASNLGDAQFLYDAHFSDGTGPGRRGAVTAMNVEAFKEWLANGDTRKPLSYVRPEPRNAAPGAATPVERVEPPVASPPPAPPPGAATPRIQPDMLGGPAVTEEQMVTPEIAAEEIEQYRRYGYDDDKIRDAMESQIERADDADPKRRIWQAALDILAEKEPRRIPMREAPPAAQTMPAVPGIGEGLFIELGNKRYEVKSFEEASRRFLEVVNAAGVPGASQTPTVLVTDAAGNVIGHVAYNGRVFPGRPGEWKPGTQPLYDSRLPGATLDQTAGARSQGPIVEATAVDWEHRQPPRGPRVIVNQVGQDGKTDAERKAQESPVFVAKSLETGRVSEFTPATPKAMTPGETFRASLEKSGEGTDAGGTIYQIRKSKDGRTWGIQTRREGDAASFFKGPAGPYEVWGRDEAINRAVRDAYFPEAAEGSPQKIESGHFAAGKEAFAAGEPRQLPSYFTKPTKNSRDWLRGWDAAAKEKQAPVTEPPQRAKMQVEEKPDGVQGSVSRSDAPAGPAAVQGTEPDREAGRPRPEQSGRSEPDAGRSPQQRTEVPERSAEEPRRPETGGRERDGDTGRVPAGERADAGVKGENFHITDGALHEGRGWKQKAQDNIRAIELMRQIEAEGRPATQAEQENLALYVGWGGIKGAFPDAQGKFEKGFEEIGENLKSLLSETEYATARRSIQYAHYTSETIVRAMWDAAVRMGFKGGRVFEPGMGVGNFAGMMPADVAEATVYNGLELDHTTARIARLLYPRWGVRQDDFTKAPVPKDTYDLVIGNPPFADIPIKSDPDYAKHSFLLHDYFFAKSIDAVRPGGLLLFVSSAGTMNKIDTKAREYLAERADFIGAIRLPGDAFEKNAGTAVTTDIIMLRKKVSGEPFGVIDGAVLREHWVETTEVTLPNKDGVPTSGRVNRWFVRNRSLVLGEEGFFDKLYQNRYAVRSDGRDLKAALAKAMEDVPSGILAAAPSSQEKAEVDFGTAERKEGAFYLSQDGALMQISAGVGRPVATRGKGVEGGLTAAAVDRIKGLIPIRDALRAVYDADLKGDAENAAKSRARLNKGYDAFVKKFGPINKAEISYRRPNVIQQEAARNEAREEARFAGNPFDDGSFDPSDLIERSAPLSEIARQRKAAKEEALKAGREWREGTFDPEDMPDTVIDRRPNIDPFMDDPESYRLRAIERFNEATGEAQKTAVFYENVITRERAPEISSIGDALLYVLNKRGRVDLAEIAKAANVSESEAVEQLGSAIFQVPGTDDTWQTREQYLSGNVRQKLRLAKAAAERNPAFHRNVEALEAAQPAPLPPSEISANLGMPWIPTEVIEDFGRSLDLADIRVRHTQILAQWFVEGDRSSAAATTTWGTPDRAAPLLISDALNRTDPKIYDTVYVDGKPKQVINPTATQAAQDKVREIKERFAEWIWSDEARTAELSAIYNEQYNNLVVPEYDGSYLTTPGIASTWSWRPHQKRAIARIIQAGNTYLAHAVGAGKTSEMIGAAMEMRRLGLVKKPMFTVPNHMLGQFTKEFYEQYPTARIAVADERKFHAGRRKQFIADIANDDLDAVIITHSAFNLIPISETFQDGLIQDQIDQYRDILQETDKNDPEQRITRRRLENAVEKLEQRLSGKKGKRKDQVYTFEEMGVDFLFVDEAHLFRKLDFATKMSNVKGISPEGSKAAFDLFAKTRYLETVNPGRNLVLASGTPVTNTMAELFTVSRYLQINELWSRGLGHFDSWAGAFGDTVTQLEQDPAGGYKPVTRFAKFVNVPELSAMVRQVMDVVTSRQLEQYVTRPKLKGGKRQMNLAEKTEVLDEYQKDLARRMKLIAQRKGPPSPGDDIILSVINDGRHAAIDMRLVDPTLPSDPGSKLNLLIDNVYRIWKETKRQAFHKAGQGGYSDKPVDHGPAAQMVFSNLGVGNTRAFSVHRFIVNDLVRRGVPKSQIALIADYKSHVAKQRLLNDVNEGKVRVVIGSTAKMATGVNAQRRLYAVHNLDPLWYPADDEQRNGRIIRQGNTNPEIEIHDYSTKGTYDSTMWGLMETKARFIQGFFEGDPSIRDMEDLGEASQYEQAKAITTADPRLIELTDLKQQLEKARRRKAAFERDQYAIRNRIAEAKSVIERAALREPQIRKDIDRRQDTAGDAFKAKAGGKTYKKRGEFGEALMAAIDEMPKKDRKGINLGEIGGFEIMADMGQNVFQEGKPWRAEVYIAREGGFATDIKASGSATGIVQSLEAALRAFENDLAFQHRRRDEANKTLADYTPKLGKSFTGQEEIDTLAQRVRELQAQLGAEAEITRQAEESEEDESGERDTGTERFSLRPEFVRDVEAIASDLGKRLEKVGIADRVALRLVENIRRMADGKASEADGRYVNGLIDIALEAPDKTWTLDHETIHALRDLGLFTEAEWSTLAQAAQADTGRMDGIRGRYEQYDLTEDQLVEEAVADMFADWTAGRSQTGGRLLRFFNRIKAFFKALREALTGRGYKTAEDIFGAVESGEVGRRDGKAGESEAYAFPKRADAEHIARQNQAATGLAWTVRRDDNGNWVPSTYFTPVEMMGETADMVQRASREAMWGRSIPEPPRETRDIPMAAEPSFREPMPEYEAEAKKLLGKDADPKTLLRRGRREIQSVMKAMDKEKARYSIAPTQGPNGRLTIEERADSGDISVFKRYFYTPQAAFKRWPALAGLQRFGVKTEVEMSKFVRRLNERYDAVRGNLSDDQFQTLSDLLFAGDAAQREYTAEELAAYGKEVAEAYTEVRDMFDTIGRFVDQHRRAMMPQLRARKLAILKRMASLRDMESPAFRSLYNRRGRLRSQLRRGEGNPEEIAKQLDAVEAEMKIHREATDEYADLAKEVDAIEASLAQTSVRRRKGYVPHKFFGTWAVYRVTEDEDGEAHHALVAGDHGFFPDRDSAVKAAGELLKAEPDANLVARPIQFSFPDSQATALTDASYFRFMQRVGKELEIKGEELHGLVKGVARRPFRRRIAGFAQFRQGVDGYSKDFDRVMRVHIGEAVRYVMLDRLKYEAIGTMERMGISPNRSANASNATLQATVLSWFRDVNGQKQPLESQVDEILDKPWAKPVRTAMLSGTALGAISFGVSSSPLVGALVGSYIGYRVYRALHDGGAFKSRAMTGAMLGDMAHLKLGSFFNVFSPVVNLTQTIINTVPLLGTYTMTGIKLLQDAFASRLKGKPNRYWRLLERADIVSAFKYTEQGTAQFSRESKLAHASLFLFSKAEQFNRAVSFLGAYQKAIDEGRSEGDAFRRGEAMMIRTQFHYGNAAKPEIIRNIFLRVPGQFKNFMAQEIAFIAGLDKKTELPRFLLSLFLVAGTLGLPGLDLLDELMEWWAGFSPITEIKRLTLKAQAEGKAWGSVANLIARGLPGLIGEDMSARAGVGDKFLPLDSRDFKGPWISTLESAVRMGELNATVADHMRNLSTGVGRPLKSLEAWANGLPIQDIVLRPKVFYEALADGKIVYTNPWKGGALEYNENILSNADLARMAVGGTPRHIASLRDVDAIKLYDEAKMKEKTQRYLGRIVDAHRRYSDAASHETLTKILSEVAADARKDGVSISHTQVTAAMKKAFNPRVMRTVQGTRKQLRPEVWGLAREAVPRKGG